MELRNSNCSFCREFYRCPLHTSFLDVFANFRRKRRDERARQNFKKMIAKHSKKCIPLIRKYKKMYSDLDVGAAVHVKGKIKKEE